MKLTDLIAALAEEVNIMRPQLSEIVTGLQQINIEDVKFIHLLDAYNDYVGRLGEASEMIDFVGIRLICDKIAENTLLVTTISDSEREGLFDLLVQWPICIYDYLNTLNEESVTQLLIKLDKLPLAFSESEAKEVYNLLLEIITQAHNGERFQDNDIERNTEATIEDIDIQLPQDIDQHLMDGFLQESPDMANSLVEWASQIVKGMPVTIEDLQRAKRYTHTLKGTGATIGARGLASVGHNLEDILEYLEENPNKASAPIKNIVLDAAYCIEQMVGYISGVDDEPEQSLSILQKLLDIANKIYAGEDLDEVIRSNDNYLDSAITNTINSTLPTKVSFEDGEIKVVNETTMVKKNTSSKKKNHVSTLRIPVKKVDELFRLSGEITIHTSAMEDKIKLLTEQTQQIVEQNLRVQKRLFELETLVDIRTLNLMRSRSADKGSNTNISNQRFDPLEMDQYNELHSSAHALMEESSDTRMFTNILNEEISSLSAMQSRQQLLSRDLQHLVMSTRMSEVGALESRLQRNIRTTGQMTGKSVNLHMTGQDTLIDSDLISKLSDPLLHLLRNAVDHGIETPEERECKGKSAAGNIYLDFFRQGQQVVLRCADDGRGLDLIKIKNRAIEHGLISEQQNISNHEVAQLILESGFSSRDTVSEISGRGVGLDVVRDWASQMNGNIHIDSSQYGGCLFELRFSASLSTIQSLVVSTSKNTYFAIPAIQVEQAITHGVGKFDYLNTKFSYFYEDEYISAYFLEELVGLPVAPEKKLDSYNAIIVSVNAKRYAFAIDKLIDSRELLVKAPGRFARHLQGVSGLSVLGNGAIAVNLDLAQLIDNIDSQGGLKSRSVVLNEDVKQKPKILIVDDALTVRNSLQQFIQDIGFEAYTARDGFEAVNVLKEMRPSVVLSDMEMPNMNGIELTKYIRSKEGMSDLPVIMITSRSQSKHKKLAEDAGVSDYITKPYNDSKLLVSIKQFL